MTEISDASNRAVRVLLARERGAGVSAGGPPRPERVRVWSVVCDLYLKCVTLCVYFKKYV